MFWRKEVGLSTDANPSLDTGPSSMFPSCRFDTTVWELHFVGVKCGIFSPSLKLRAVLCCCVTRFLVALGSSFQPSVLGKPPKAWFQVLTDSPGPHSEPGISWEAHLQFSHGLNTKHLIIMTIWGWNNTKQNWQRWKAHMFDWEGSAGAILLCKIRFRKIKCWKWWERKFSIGRNST